MSDEQDLIYMPTNADGDDCCNRSDIDQHRFFGRRISEHVYSEEELCARHNRA